MGRLTASGGLYLSKQLELAEYLKSLGYKVEVLNNTVRVLHDVLPLYLELEFKDRFVYISIKHTDDFRDYLEEMRDMGEDIEEQVETAMSYLSIAALKARQWIEDKELVPVFKLREGSIEISETLEELVEEEEESEE